MTNQITFSNLLNAGVPILYVRTVEQERAYMSLAEESKAVDRETYIWKINTGLLPSEYIETSEAVAQSPLEALQYTYADKDGNGCAEKVVYFLLNFKPYLANYAFIQELRDAASILKSHLSHIVMIGADIDLPPELEDIVTFHDFDLPNSEEIEIHYKDLLTGSAKEGFTVPADTIRNAATTSVGMSLFRCENALGVSLVTTGDLDIKVLTEEKKSAIKKSGALEFKEIVRDMTTVGGFGCLKKDVAKKRKYYENPEAAKRFGIKKPPRGILIIGLPGTGKSLISEAIAHELQLPLINFNVGAIFKSLVGQSESEMRTVLKLVEKLAPCVLRIDEMDKLFAGGQSSGKTDSGVTSKVIAQWLTWQQETPAPVFTVATCNSLDSLDGPMTRRGRWDNIYAVDVPTEEERESIFDIHLKLRDRDPKDFAVSKFIEKSAGFTGAEIESAIDDAMHSAFAGDDILSDQIILTALSSVTPMVITDKEDVTKFREWAGTRAVWASDSTPAKSKIKVPAKRKISGVSAPKKMLLTGSN